MAYMTNEELKNMGFAKIGSNILISKKASFYRCDKISIGSNVRIDDFCVLSAGDGGIFIQDFIHIAVYSSLIGKECITISNFANISSKVSIYSSNDDYSGLFMSNPMVPTKFTNVKNGRVLIGEHAIIGCGAVILPDVKINKGAVVGALSVVKQDCDEFAIYAGVPARFIKARSRDLLVHEKNLLDSQNMKG